jgi:hypothetical protein
MTLGKDPSDDMANWMESRLTERSESPLLVHSPPVCIFAMEERFHADG